MTSQKTVERCRARVAELEAANKVLLENNEKLASANKQLRESNRTLTERVDSDISKIEELTFQKDNCKQKCQLALAEREAELFEAQRKAANVKTLKDIKWSLDNTDGKIILTGVLP